MKKASRKITTVTETFTFTDTEIEDILLEHIGYKKGCDYSCNFDVGQCFNGAEIIVKYFQEDSEAE